MTGGGASSTPMPPRLKPPLRPPRTPSRPGHDRASRRVTTSSSVSVTSFWRARTRSAASSREEGKTLAEGVGETGRAAQIFLFFSGECLRLAGNKLPSTRPGVDVEITREPIGVVGMITPWNFPIAIPAWKIAPALAYGNCVVFKPADLVPATAHALSEVIIRAGMPAGVFNLVMGRGSVVGQAMLEHPDVAAISFTGSVQSCIFFIGFPAGALPRRALPRTR